MKETAKADELQYKTDEADRKTEDERLRVMCSNCSALSWSDEPHECRQRETLFSVSNRHVKDCGEPPEINGDDREKYFGYLVNGYGEQAIYIYDFKTHKATVRMGDAGWKAVYPVVNGEAVGVIVNDAERLWLRACWMASGALRILPKKED